MILTRKINGEITTEIVSSREAAKIGSAKSGTITHLCWAECPVGLCNAKACPKVFDIEKKSIEEYDFINSGIEAYKNSGEFVFFIVEDCELYNKYQEENSKIKVKK